LAYAVSLLVVHLVARARPFAVVPRALVLVTRPTGFSFPNEHAVIAGAVATGLWLSRAQFMAAVATLVAVAIISTAGGLVPLPTEGETAGGAASTTAAVVQGNVAGPGMDAFSRS